MNGEILLSRNNCAAKIVEKALSVDYVFAIQETWISNLDIRKQNLYVRIVEQGSNVSVQPPNGDLC